MKNLILFLMAVGFISCSINTRVDDQLSGQDEEFLNAEGHLSFTLNNVNDFVSELNFSEMEGVEGLQVTSVSYIGQYGRVSMSDGKYIFDLKQGSYFDYKNTSVSFSDEILEKMTISVLKDGVQSNMTVSLNALINFDPSFSPQTYQREIKRDELINLDVTNNFEVFLSDSILGSSLDLNEITYINKSSFELRGVNIEIVSTAERQGFLVSANALGKSDSDIQDTEQTITMNDLMISYIDAQGDTHIVSLNFSYRIQGTDLLANIDTDLLTIDKESTNYTVTHFLRDSTLAKNFSYEVTNSSGNYDTTLSVDSVKVFGLDGYMFTLRFNNIDSIPLGSKRVSQHEVEFVSGSERYKISINFNFLIHNGKGSHPSRDYTVPNKFRSNPSLINNYPIVYGNVGLQSSDTVLSLECDSELWDDDSVTADDHIDDLRKDITSEYNNLTNSLSFSNLDRDIINRWVVGGNCGTLDSCKFYVKVRCSGKYLDSNNKLYNIAKGAITVRFYEE